MEIYSSLTLLIAAIARSDSQKLGKPTACNAIVREKSVCENFWRLRMV